MIRRYPSSGSAYTYAQKSIHPNVGFMVGWSSWLDYLLSPMVNIILAVIYLEALFPDVNHWVWVVVLTAFMTGVNLRGARFVANFNSYDCFGTVGGHWRIYLDGVHQTSGRFQCRWSNYCRSNAISYGA